MIKIFSIASLLISLLNSTGIYDHSVPKIESGTQSLSAFAGKRLLIVTLPVVQSPEADSLLYALDTIAVAHMATHKVIAVPSFEDGFTAGQKANLLTWYRSKLGNNILITDGLYTHRSSGSQQHGLFKWLSDVSQNGIFNISPDEPGYKFFIMENGRLYGILHPQVKLWGTSVFKALTITEETE